MAVRRLILFAALAASLTLAAPAWAGSLQFHGNSFVNGGEGTLSFTPGLGNDLTISAGNGGNGALITDFFSTGGASICGGDCPIIGGYMTLTTGGETGGSAAAACSHTTLLVAGPSRLSVRFPHLASILRPSCLWQRWAWGHLTAADRWAQSRLEFSWLALC